MKKLLLMTILISVFVFAVANESFAQRGMIWIGEGGWGPGSQYNRLIDSKTIEKISGEVVSVETVTPIRGMHQGVQIVIKTEKETISVHLGPAWFLENQDVKIMPKEKVEVTGLRITFQGKPTIIATEVRKDDQVLKLRDENRYPVWSGWRRR